MSDKSITKARFKKALKDVLLGNPPERAEYENRRPNKEELDQKWKLEKRKNVKNQT